MIQGLPGALVGYVVGLVVSAWIPDAGTACAVPPRDPPEESPTDPA